MEEMNTNQVVDMLLSKETELVNKFNQTISEILRLEYNTERGKNEVIRLISSVKHSLDEIDMKVNR